MCVWLVKQKQYLKILFSLIGSLSHWIICILFNFASKLLARTPRYVVWILKRVRRVGKIPARFTGILLTNYFLLSACFALPAGGVDFLLSRSSTRILPFLASFAVFVHRCFFAKKKQNTRNDNWHRASLGAHTPFSYTQPNRGSLLWNYDGHILFSIVASL